MGQKVSPIGFRTGITLGWKSRWFAPKSNYGEFLVEDAKIRRFIDERLNRQPPYAAISSTEIERTREEVKVVLRTARPGLVIGPKGAEVDKLKSALEEMTDRRVNVNIVEIRNPDLDAQLVAEGIAEQLKRRSSFRRTMKQRAGAVMGAGAKGVKLMIAGRLGGAEIARREKTIMGSIPLHTLQANVDYGFAASFTKYGCIGVKVWIYHGLFGEEAPKEDESALVLWALWDHYQRFRDIEFIRPLYRPLIIRVGDFLESYRDEETGLPLPSWDLWEERCGIHAFTCGAVHGGLAAACEFAKMFGQHDKAQSYADTCAGLRQAMDDHLYDPELGRFMRSLSKDGGEPDTTLDASISGAWAFGAYPPDDPRVLSTAEQLRAGLSVKTAVGGISRYENDYYWQASEDTARIPGNHWFICTLWDALHRTQLCETEEQLTADVLPALVWTAERALPSGVLAEQLHPETGAPMSVSPLTWSHATFVECVMAYLARIADLRRCPTCQLSTFIYSRFGRT